MFGSYFETKFISRRQVAFDCTAVAIIAFLSLAPYRASLGFYSDDYSLMAAFANAADPSISGHISLMMDSMANIRPVQVVSIVLLYHQFGLSPFGYQVIIWLVYMALAPALYLVLRELRQLRLIAVAPSCPSVYLNVQLIALQIPTSAVFYLVGVGNRGSSRPPLQYPCPTSSRFHSSSLIPSSPDYFSTHLVHFTQESLSALLAF